jgi:tRNA-dihydrouridine synthase
MIHMMSCDGNNATPPSPAIAPGADGIDPRQVALEVGRRGVDPRLAAVVPGVDAPFFQAGLAGYSDAARRIVARRHGCPMCITEALLDRSLLGGGHGFDKADLGLLADNVPGGDEDHPLVGQIMGSDPDEMAAAAVKMVEQGRRPGHEYRKIRDRGLEAAPRSAGGVEASERTFATIDVNLACPVKKIKAKARGGHWLRDPDGAIEILRAVRAAVPREIPVTVKMRRGSDDSAEAEGNFRRIFEGAYEAGCAWVTVHGRTVEQKYVGPSRWTFLRDLVARYPDRLIFGSGDVWSVEEIFRMIGYTGVQAVSVARGCIGNPWIFRQARDMMAGREPAWPTIDEQREVLREHFELSVAVNGEERAGRMMRKFGIKFSRHHPRGEEVKMRMVRVSSVEDWLGVLEEYYTDPSRVPEHAGAA